MKENRTSGGHEKPVVQDPEQTFGPGARMNQTRYSDDQALGDLSAADSRGAEECAMRSLRSMMLATLTLYVRASANLKCDQRTLPGWSGR
jgi:hypothetical protein